MSSPSFSLRVPGSNESVCESNMTLQGLCVVKEMVVNGRGCSLWLRGASLRLLLAEVSYARDRRHTAWVG